MTAALTLQQAGMYKQAGMYSFRVQAQRLCEMWHITSKGEQVTIASK